MALHKMFSLIKKVVILLLMTCSSGNIIKNITSNFIKISTESFLQNLPSCFLLKNEECKVRKVIVDNDYTTFPYKIKFDKCVGSCNDIKNPYFKICLPDSVENISVKVFDLLSQRNKLRDISFHKSCKCSSLLDKKV